MTTQTIIMCATCKWYDQKDTETGVCVAASWTEENDDGENWIMQPQTRATARCNNWQTYNPTKIQRLIRNVRKQLEV